MTERDDDSGFSFTLPPIRLPPMTLPDRVRLIVPVFEHPTSPELSTRLRVRVRTLVALALLFDVIDALFVLRGSPAPWFRAVVGTALLFVVVGPAGVAYLWEALAVFAGVGWLAVVPSATLLLLTRLLRQVDFLGRGHPEQVDRETEREREHPDEDEGGPSVSHAGSPESNRAAQQDGRGDVHEGDEQERVHHGTPFRREAKPEKPDDDRRDDGVDEDDDQKAERRGGRDHAQS